MHLDDFSTINLHLTGEITQVPQVKETLIIGGPKTHF